MGEWVSIHDKLPENACRVLCACWDFATKLYWHELLWFINNHWLYNVELNTDYTQYVTHWMPLPEFPKEG